MEANATMLLNDHGLTLSLNLSELQALELEYAPRTRGFIAGGGTENEPVDRAA